MSVDEEQSMNRSVCGQDLKSSLLTEMMKDGLSRILDVFRQEEFIFVVNGRRIRSTFAEALLISPAVYAAFRNDNTNRTFKVCEKGIDGNDFDFDFLLKLIRFEIEIDDDIECQKIAFVDAFPSPFPFAFVIEFFNDECLSWQSDFSTRFCHSK
jgi:hypothetical protein